MKEAELESLLLSFPASQMRIDEENKLKIFEINFPALEQIWKEKLLGDIGDFEKTTGEKIIQNINNNDQEKAIFAIIHDGSLPLQFEVKTGVNLAKILREKESVVPSKFMNEREWNKIIGFGQIPADEAKDLVVLSYRLVSEG